MQSLGPALRSVVNIGGDECVGGGTYFPHLVAAWSYINSDCGNKHVQILGYLNVEVALLVFCSVL